jgi:hypothetical protein
VLDVNANGSDQIDAPDELHVYRIPAGTVGETVLFALDELTTDPNIDVLVYEDDDGVNPIFNTYVGFFSPGPYGDLFFGNGEKDVYVTVQDYFLFGGGLPYEYDITFASLNPAALATQLTNQQLAAAGAENFYYIDTDKWSIGTVTVTGEVVGPVTPNFPRITVQQDAGIPTVFAAGTTTNNQLSFLQLPGQTAIFGFRDNNNDSSGADSAYTVAWSQASVGDATTDAGITVPVDIPDAAPGIVIPIDPATGFTTLTAVHVGLDIRHTWRGDLLVELRSPSGLTTEVIFFAGGSTDNWITIVPDLADPSFYDETAFNSEQNIDGVWELYIEDDAGGDIGRVESAALIFEGS